MDKTIFCQNLRRLRKERGLIQAALAELAGISDRYYQNLEVGVKDPSLDTIFKLAEALKVNPGNLLNDPAQEYALSNEFWKKQLETMSETCSQLLRFINSFPKIHSDVVTFFAALDPDQQLENLAEVRKSHHSETEAVARLKKSSLKPLKSRSQK